MADPIKISVLADGTLLLGSEPAPFEYIKRALAAAPKDAVVWYYRQNSPGEPPPVAMGIIRAITEQRLAIRLSAKPDFSEFVTPFTGMEGIFAPIREKAAQGNLVILRPNGQFLVLPGIPREKANPEGVASMERLLPSTPRRRVAVVADTKWTLDASPSVQRASESIPFFGLLMGLTSIGHAVWVVGPETDLAGACRESDLLIVDSACAASMPRGWDERAYHAMSSRQILIHDRATYKLVPLA
jgi:hypothetical protein